MKSAPLLCCNDTNASRIWRAAVAMLCLLLAAVDTHSDRPAAAGESGPAPRGLGVRCLAFSPDGKRLAASTGEPKERGQVTVWDVAARKRLFVHQEEDGVPGVAFSPNGELLAVAVYDETAKLLDAATGQVRATLRGHTAEVRAVAFAPDGRTLASGGWDHTVRLWDTASGALRQTLEGHTQRIFSVAFAPDGRWLVSAGYDGARLWETATGQEKHLWKHGQFVTRCALFAGDSRVLTGGYDGTVRLWDAASGQSPLRLRGAGGVEALAYSPAVRTLAVCDHGTDVYLFDFTLDEPAEPDRQRLLRLLAQLDNDDYQVREAAGKAILEMGFLAEGGLRRAMKDGPSAEVRLRARRLRAKLLSEPRALLTGHTERVEAVAFSPDGKLLASAGRDGRVRLWETATRKPITTFTPEDGAADGSEQD